MRNLVPIGRFATVSRLTIKALRYYDEQGLLHPALVDPATGFRYYSVGQAREAEIIRVLRTVDMPLAEIRALLAEPEPDLVRKRLARHRDRLEGRLANQVAALDFLTRLMEEDLMSYEVTTRVQQEQPYLGMRRMLDGTQPDIGAFAAEAFRTLFMTLGKAGRTPAGPPFAVYHAFGESGVDVEFGVPVHPAAQGEGEVVAGTLPAGPVMATLHAGPYDQIGPAYQALTEWAEANGREPAGPPAEFYLVGPDQAEPGGYRTEVVWLLKA